MYKCSECGTEFEIKPDYCDCGNNTFEQIKSISQENNEDITKQQQFRQKEDTKQKLQDYKPSRRQYSSSDRLKNSFDPISTLIFIFCIILSISIIFFIGNPKQTIKKNEEKELSITNIPPLDSFWDNTPVKIQPDIQEKEPEIITNKTPEPIQKIILPAHKDTPNKTSKIPSSTLNKTPQSKKQLMLNQGASPKTLKPQQKKAVPTPDAKLSALTKRVQTNAQNSINNNQNKQQTPQTSSKQTSQTQASKPAIRSNNTTSNNTNNIIQQTQQISVTEPKIDQQAIKKEYANYKISLRNTLGKKINFTNVVGDGECIVSFKISTNGQLVNRAFTKKSSNLTLNDAVYSAMLSTPSYTAPPEGYRNETLSLKVLFYNGNFDISLY